MVVAEGLRLRVSRHFHHSTLGLFDRGDPQLQLHEYICEGTPGTGFIVRRTDSHSYRRFVAECRKRTKQNILTLLLGKEPNFNKERQRVEAAVANCTDGKKRRFLNAYLGVLPLAKEEELLQRVERAIKERIEKRPNHALVSVLMHYKSSIATIEHDFRLAQMDATEGLTPAQLTAWTHLVECFKQLVDARRVWSVYTVDNAPSYKQVFFDMGMFDYIKSPLLTPVMRDYTGMRYYLYPMGVVVSRTSIDFDVHGWKEIKVASGEVELSTLAIRPQMHSKHRRKMSDALSTLYGASRNKLGELFFSGLEARFYTNHAEPAIAFAAAVEEWKKVM